MLCLKPVAQLRAIDAPVLTHIVTIAEFMHTAKEIARINLAMSQIMADMSRSLETYDVPAQLIVLAAAAENTSDYAIRLTELDVS